jgi:hypothetical protein
MKTLKVYEWLLTNQMFLAAPALVTKFNLMGELQHEVILEFLEKYLVFTSMKDLEERLY